jgi:hypothetical protein
MLIDLGEVFLCLLGCGGTETLVVLYLPLFKISPLSPIFKFVDGEKRADLVTLGGFKQRGNKFLEEAIHMHERGPEVMNEIDEQPFNMGAIMV